MNPQSGKLPPDGTIPEARGRLALWMIRLRSVAWVVSLTAGLAVIYALLPATLWRVFWHGLQAQRILAGMLLVFSLLALSLVWSKGQRVDSWAFLYFNLRGPRPPWLDRLMLRFTQIGNGIAALAMAPVFYLVGDRLLAYELVLGTLTLWLVVELVKAVAHRSRPFVRLTQARIIGHRMGGRSFPSGHTSQAFFMATLMTQHFHASGWLVSLLYAIALLVGITRMVVGAHYPRDVLAGAILGSAWGLLGRIVDG
jgi:membrane-associated phospholipid phosphatase